MVVINELIAVSATRPSNNVLDLIFGIQPGPSSFFTTTMPFLATPRITNFTRGFATSARTLMS